MTDVTAARRTHAQEREAAWLRAFEANDGAMAEARARDCARLAGRVVVCVTTLWTCACAVLCAAATRKFDTAPMTTSTPSDASPASPSVTAAPLHIVHRVTCCLVGLLVLMVGAGIADFTRLARDVRDVKRVLASVSAAVNATEPALRKLHDDVLRGDANVLGPQHVAGLLSGFVVAMCVVMCISVDVGRMHMFFSNFIDHNNRVKDTANTLWEHLRAYERREAEWRNTAAAATAAAKQQ